MDFDEILQDTHDMNSLTESPFDLLNRLEAYILTQQNGHLNQAMEPFLNRERARISLNRGTLH